MAPDVSGADRRHSRRVLLNQLCTLHFADLLTPVKATIVDLSAGGMRLRIPRIQERHLAQGFRVQWDLGGMEVKARVMCLYASSANEIAVAYQSQGARLQGEITKFIFARLRRDRDLQHLPGPHVAEAPSAGQDAWRHRRANGYYQSRSDYWLERRVATHL